MLRNMIVLLTLAFAYVVDHTLGHSATGLLALAAVAPITPAPAGDKAKHYACEDKTLIPAMRKIIDAAGTMQKAEQGARKLVALTAAQFGMEYNGPFAAWCTKNNIKHTLLQFGISTLDLTPGSKDYKTAGTKESSIYWAISNLSQQHKTMLKVAEREKTVKAKITELIAAGMAVEEATTKAEAEIPVVGMGARGTGADVDETPLKRYQKALASVLTTITETPRELATALLTSLGVGEDGQKSFNDNVLPKFKGSDIVRRYLDAYAIAWIAAHVDAVVSMLQKTGYVIAYPVGNGPNVDEHPTAANERVARGKRGSKHAAA